MSDDQIKYNQALARQNFKNNPCAVVKKLWTPEYIEVTRGDGQVFYFQHNCKFWSVVEVKK